MLILQVSNHGVQIWMPSRWVGNKKWYFLSAKLELVPTISFKYKERKQTSVRWPFKKSLEKKKSLGNPKVISRRLVYSRTYLDNILIRIIFCWL